MPNKNENQYPYNLITDVISNSDLTDADCLLPFDVEGSVEYILTTLLDRERKIIGMYYKDKMTYADIAKIYGLTSSRIPQIINKALHKLRHPSRIQYITKGVAHIIDEQKAAFFKEELYEIKALVGGRTNADGVVIRERSTPLRQLDLSVRSYNCLRRAGITTLGELADLSHTDIAKIRNIGRHSYCEIIDVLARNGYATNIDS